jgi:hypothetical protein
MKQNSSTKQKIHVGAYDRKCCDAMNGIQTSASFSKSKYLLLEPLLPTTLDG